MSSVSHTVMCIVMCNLFIYQARLSSLVNEEVGWMEPSGGPLSTQCTPSEEYWRPPSGFSKCKPLATSSARPKAKNPRGLRPLGFLVWPWLWPRVCLQKIPWGTFNLLPRKYIEYSGNSLGAPFTMLPPRLSHRLSQCVSVDWLLLCLCLDYY